MKSEVKNLIGSIAVVATLATGAYIYGVSETNDQITDSLNATGLTVTPIEIIDTIKVVPMSQSQLTVTPDSIK